MKRRGVLPGWFSFFLVALVSILPASLPAAEPAPSQTLCILDLNRHGDDGSMDWLRRGLSDMLITSMNRLGPYQVVQRHQLRAILREHRLSSQDPAIRQARIARADFLLLGNFGVDDGELRIELRFLRVDDQKVLAQVFWKGAPARVLDAPAALTRQLLAARDVPVDEDTLVGLERALPRSVDRAAAFYEGEQADDVGDRPRALTRYLDAARNTTEFLPAHRAVLRMYGSLGLEAHAVAYASDLAARLERIGDLRHALEFDDFVAHSLLESFETPQFAARWFEKIVELSRRHEDAAPPEERTVARARVRALELSRSPQHSGRDGLQILDHPDIRLQIWTRDLDRQLARRERLRSRGGLWRLEGSRWIQKEVPDPTVFMWKIRALHQLATLERQRGRLEKAMAHLREIIVDYQEVAELPIFRPGEDFYWGQGMRSQLRQLLVAQQRESGSFPRDSELLDLARVHVVRDQGVFRRDFERLAADSRAAERYKQVESFHFLAEAGLQIESVTFETEVHQLAGFHFGLEKREHARELLLERGVHRNVIRLPPGTEFLSLRSSWGGILFLNHPELTPPLFSLGSRSPEIAWWEARFRLSRRSGTSTRRVTKGAEVERHRAQAAAARRVARFVEREGWEGGSVDRTATSTEHLHRAPLDGRALEWRVESVDGDLRIVRRSEPQVSLALPRPIRSVESERGPSLVKSHDGGFALFWSRGPAKRPDRFYVASSRDLVHWSEPRALALAGGADSHPEPTGKGAVRAKTDNVLTTRTSYVMILDGGLVRHSDDLAEWSAPSRVLPADSTESLFLQTLDRRVWAVYCEASREEKPYTSGDAMIGYYVRGGRKYKRLYDVLVTSSSDGKTWTPPRKILTHGEPSELWAFPITEKGIVVAALYNGRFLQWAVGAGPDRFERVSTPIRHLSRRGAQFFVERGQVVCVQDVRIGARSPKARQTMTLVLRSKELHETLTKPLH